MAISKSSGKTDKMIDEQRGPRRDLRLKAEGSTSSGATTAVIIHNISRTGLLFESAIALAVDEMLEIMLPEAGPTRAKIVWASDNLFGCQFATPISPAQLSAAQLQGAATANPLREQSAVTEEAPPSDEYFGSRLQRLRKEKGLTLSQIAEQIGVSAPAVWAWEKGRARPHGARLVAIEAALGISRPELVGENLPELLHELTAKSRAEIAKLVGISPQKVRITVEI